MGKATVYCEKCGEMIPEEDFAKGKAVHFESKDYCQACKAEIAHLLPKGGGVGVSKRSSGMMPSVKRSSGILPAVQAPDPRPPSGLAKAPASLRPKAGTPNAFKSPLPGVGGHGRSRHEDSRPNHEQGAGLSKNAIVAIVGGGGILLVIVIVLVMQSMNAKAEQERKERLERNAVEALQECQVYFKDHPEDFDGTLAKIAQGRPKAEQAEGTNYYSRLVTLENEVKKKKDEFLQKQVFRDRLHDLVEKGKRDLATIPPALRELQRLPTEAGKLGEDFGREFARKVGEERRVLQETYVRESIRLVEADLKDLTKVESIEPFKKRYEAILTDIPDLDATLRSQVLNKIKELETQWFLLAEQALAQISADVDRLIEAKKFEEALRRTNDFPKKFELTPSYPKKLALEDKVKRARERARETPKAQPPGGGDGSGGGGNGPTGGADGANLEVLDTILLLHSGTDLGGWKTVGIGNKPSTVEWSCPEAGVIHAVNGSADGGGAIFKGSERWLEYDYEFDVKCVKGDFIVIVLVSGTGWCPVKMPAPIPRDQFHRFRVSVTTSDVVIQRPDRKESISIRDSHSGSKSGKVGFGLIGGDEAYFRNPQVTVHKLSQ
ncbi:MAG: hypothetical protein HYZ53_30675 [Planctomycetes bacterium]|nr:hypothetical protein [Planctomycetota bacterium]